MSAGRPNTAEHVVIWREYASEGMVIQARRVTQLASVRDIVLEVGFRAVSGEFRLRLAFAEGARVLHARYHDIKRWEPGKQDAPVPLEVSVWIDDIDRERIVFDTLKAIRSALEAAAEANVCSRSQVRDLVKTCRLVLEGNH